MPRCNAAVNHIQPEALTRDAIRAVREAGFRSISIDLIYGLPLQDAGTMAATLDKVVAAAPDRISAHHYAHVPQLSKSRKLIRDEDLPDGATKPAMLGLCIERLFRQAGGGAAAADAVLADGMRTLAWPRAAPRSGGRVESAHRLRSELRPKGEV